MLDETALRTSGFTEGCRVQLADGQEWSFPRPKFRFFPCRDANGKIAMGGRSTFDDEYRTMISEFQQADRDDVHRMWSLKMQIACHLLLANYNLSDADLAELLSIDFEDETNVDMWTALTPVILSLPPKPSTDGSPTI
jgi:hypothetical protein